MKFLTDIDIEAHLLQTFSKGRDKEDVVTIFENLELQNIEIIKSKLNGRYNSTTIFSATGSARHWLIVKILTKLVVYDFVRRNAARNVSNDFVKEYEWAMKILERINAGKENPDGLPLLTKTDGTKISSIKIGNTSDKNYMI